MAASSKPTAVHFSLVFFVMVCLILGVVVYLKWADATEFQRQLQAETQRANDLSNALDRQLAQAQNIKELIGDPNAQDLGGPSEPGTAYMALNTYISTQGGDQSRNTVRETMSAMRTEINNLQDQVRNLSAGEETLSTRALAAESTAQDRAATAGSDRPL
jgi:CHASE3 domain sensor protein